MAATKRSTEAEVVEFIEETATLYEEYLANSATEQQEENDPVKDYSNLDVNFPGDNTDMNQSYHSDASE